MSNRDLLSFDDILNDISTAGQTALTMLDSVGISILKLGEDGYNNAIEIKNEVVNSTETVKSEVISTTYGWFTSAESKVIDAVHWVEYIVIGILSFIIMITILRYLWRNRPCCCGNRQVTNGQVYTQVPPPPPVQKQPKKKKRCCILC